MAWKTILTHFPKSYAHQSPPVSTTVSCNAPPGAKVGLIAARRTGYKRGRQALTEKDRSVD